MELSYNLSEEVNSILYEYNNQKIVIIVEGEDDKIFYKLQFQFNSNQVYFHVPYKADDNKSRVIELVKMNSEFTDIIGIIDSDFDRMEDNLIQHPKLFYTDYHDLEMFVVISNSFEKMLANRGVTKSDLREIPDLQKKENPAIKEFMFSQSAILGRLRLLNQRNQWNISFKKFQKQTWKDSFYNCKAFSNLNECIHYLLSYRNSRRNIPELTTKNIMDEYQKYIDLNENEEFTQLCHGKDVFKIFIFYLNTYLRKGRREDIDKGNLYDSYERADFQETVLYKKISEYIVSSN